MTRICILALVGLGALSLPAGAAAASASLDRPCYVAGQPGVLSLSGFAPNTPVTVANADLGSLRVTTDATGSSMIPISPPAGRDLKRPGSRELVITAKEDANPANVATAKSRIAPLAFATDAGTKSPKAKRSWYFSGWAIGKPLYAHFRFPNRRVTTPRRTQRASGRTKGRFRFGIATGPCGEYKRRAPGIAVTGRVSPGQWVIQVDQSATYRKTTNPALVADTVVFTTFRPRAVTTAAAMSTAALSGLYRFGGFYSGA